MRTTRAILTAALATAFAVGTVGTATFAEAGGARRVERRDAMPAQPTTVAPGGGVAEDKAKADKLKAIRDALDAKEKELQNEDKLGNSEIQRGTANSHQNDIKLKEQIRQAQEQLE